MAVLKVTQSRGLVKTSRANFHSGGASEAPKKGEVEGLKKRKLADEEKGSSGNVVESKSPKKKRPLETKDRKENKNSKSVVGSKSSKKTRSLDMDYQKENRSHEKEKPLDRKGRKELAEFRKKKRKPNYDLEKEVKLVWENLRDRKLDKESGSKLASETLKKMKGKLVEMSASHISSRVVQSCVKHCQKPERDAVFEELRPHILTLARDTYAYHLVLRMLDYASKPQFQLLISSLHGQVVSLLRHPVGSAVVEHAYQSANATQKRELVCEFYLPEYRLFKGVTAGNCKFAELFAKETPSKQNSMLQHMSLSLQPILEKGIVDHSIIHRVLAEFLSVCKYSMVIDTVKSLAGPLLVRMIHTKDGAKVGVMCVKLAAAKERKKIITGMKGHVAKVAQDEHSNIVLLAILQVVDDTKQISKVIVKELVKVLGDVACHKYGRRVFLQLLAPGFPRYFPSDVLEVLQKPTDTNLQDRSAAASSPAEVVEKDQTKVEKTEEDLSDSDNDVTNEVRGISKKDPSLRRFEILSSDGLGMKLTEFCTENANDLLQSPIGTDLIYEVAMGGVGEVLWKVARDGVLSLHRAIAILASKPPVPEVAGQTKMEHVLEQYHSSRTIRRLILNSFPGPVGTDSPSFSATFWSIALESKCKLWSKGHSAKVISAYKICGDPSAKEASKEEVQGLIDGGLLEQN